jgi:hypothetical protein
MDHFGVFVFLESKPQQSIIHGDGFQEIWGWRVADFKPEYDREGGFDGGFKKIPGAEACI